MTMTTPKPRRTCPCQHISLSLSSATAAEYGDIESLTRRLQKKQSGDSRQPPGLSNGGITPLHLAAQHDHPAAVSLLLSEGGCNVDTGVSDNDSSVSCGATPLHRASFSGAISSMQILLDWGSDSSSKTDILARDSSFGDLKTPLHKAVAGGRPMAVQLLLMALRKRKLLERGLEVVDSQGLTPLGLVRQFTSLNDEELEIERCSVRRWDSIAGGRADWASCQELLEEAESSSSAHITTSVQEHIPEMKMDRFVSSDNKSALLCTKSDECKDGACRTAVWENAFRSALMSSLKTSLSSNVKISRNVSFNKLNPSDDAKVDKEVKHDNLMDEPKHLSVLEQEQKPLNNDEQTKKFGRVCDVCQVHSSALFHLNNNLVCRSCRRSRRV